MNLTIFVSITAHTSLKITITLTELRILSQAKRHLRKFNGIPKAHFELYLKECEWRFNHSDLKSQIFLLKQLVKGG